MRCALICFWSPEQLRRFLSQQKTRFVGNLIRCRALWACEMRAYYLSNAQTKKDSSGSHAYPLVFILDIFFAEKFRRFVLGINLHWKAKKLSWCRISDDSHSVLQYDFELATWPNNKKALPFTAKRQLHGLSSSYRDTIYGSLQQDDQAGRAQQTIHPVHRCIGTILLDVSLINKLAILCYTHFSMLARIETSKIQHFSYLYFPGSHRLFWPCQVFPCCSLPSLNILPLHFCMVPSL